MHFIKGIECDFPIENIVGSVKEKAKMVDITVDGGDELVFFDHGENANGNNSLQILPSSIQLQCPKK